MTEKQHKNMLTELWLKKQQQQDEELKRIFRLEEKENQEHDNKSKAGNS